MKRDVIIACDFPGMKETLAFLDHFEGEKPYLKIGMELYYAAGPEIVREIKRRGHKIFLDLKLHDIPNTVKSAMKVLKDLNVDMTNLHAGGGIQMMEAALEGLTPASGERQTKLIAVTMLTSLTNEAMNNELLIPGTVPETVMHYAMNAKKAGLDGIVCSPLESPIVHEKIAPDFLTVTPGVRFAGGDVGDQKRVTTPAKAKELGSDFIVVGRPITKAENPVEAWKLCMKDFAE
ncbi:MAG: orotidine-5'-phosphate decarboxylase [Clostridia bacterium]|nr:orotidine-5'-phosphate decarboxylase [Clostridia bacterium]